MGNIVTTLPGMRPAVSQKGRAWPITLAADTPQQVTNQNSEFDALVFNVYSTAANSVFLGFDSSVSVNSGLEIQPGIPMPFSLIQTRELWEVQRYLEAMTQMMAEVLAQTLSRLPVGQAHLPLMIPFKAPVVRLDTSQLYLVAAAATNVTVIGFLPQEFQ